MPLVVYRGWRGMEVVPFFLFIFPPQLGAGQAWEPLPLSLRSWDHTVKPADPAFESSTRRSSRTYCHVFRAAPSSTFFTSHCRVSLPYPVLIVRTTRPFRFALHLAFPLSKLPPKSLITPAFCILGQLVDYIMGEAWTSRFFACDDTFVLNKSLIYHGFWQCMTYHVQFIPCLKPLFNIVHPS